MLYAGIDVAKDKHDCYIITSEGVLVTAHLLFTNTRQGFEELLSIITTNEPDVSKVSIGLESTGHYGLNLENFLRRNGYILTIFNPMTVASFKKAQTLRKTKTDKEDAKFITLLLMNSPAQTKQTNDSDRELKSLERHRYRMVGQCSKLKVLYSRLVTILLPELNGFVTDIHSKTCNALLLKFPNAEAISKCHLTHLTNILSKNSKHRFKKDKAIELKNLAMNSIGAPSSAVSFELQQTIRLIQNQENEIALVDAKIKAIIDEMKSPIITIPGISYVLGSIILGEIGDINNFKSSNQLLAFAGLEPSIYQSGKFNATSTSMVKHGSKYLRWAIIQASKLIAMNDETFGAFMAKKRAEGKHYNVATSHVAKKLVRVIFHLLKNNKQFIPQI